MRVLYIDGVGPFGGASRSLFEVMRAFPEGEVDAYFVMQRGTAMDYYARVSKEIIGTRGLTRFDHTRYSHYRGKRWIVPLRELFHLPFTVAALLKARRQWKQFDLIHVNEITEIIPGMIAKWLFRAPMIVHCRSTQVVDRKLFRTRWYHRALRRHADAVVAIDETARSTLPADLPVDVIHNSFEPTPEGEPNLAYLAQLDALRPSSLKVGFVGNLHRAKGLPDLLDAAKLLRAQGEDVQFLIVGGTTQADKGLVHSIISLLGLAQNMQGELHETVANLGLSDDFLLLGPTSDIQRVYQRMDVLTFPSHFDAPGRPVFEAAFFGVPCIVAVRNPRPDTVMNGETGIAIEEPEGAQIAKAIEHFARDRGEVARMGANAKALAARNFRPQGNARLLLAVYRRVIEVARSGSHAPGPHSEGLGTPAARG